jgi:hypothetical protein
MAIGDVRLQDPSDQLQGQSPNETTPPTQGLDEGEHDDENEDEDHDQVQEKINDHKGDEEDGDKEGSNSRAKPPHPRVCHTVQKDHPVNVILGDIEKGVTTRSRFTNFCQHYSFSSSFEPFKI